MELFLIDAIGPFFPGYERKRINWSKIPFDHINLASPQREHQFAQIQTNMRQFCQRVKQTGYNAVTLDDLSHLADHPWYEDEIRQQIKIYRDEYQKLFKIITDEDLQIFLTMDVCSFTPALKQRLGSSFESILSFLEDLLSKFFKDFPQISGLIIRIGESDGLDVNGSFRSELILKTPKMLNRFLHRLLPVFESFNKRMIVRTWTVGAYRVGDLIWHRRTFKQAFSNVNSPALVLSMKYGESDFFRYLPLNRAFFHTKIPKIIELQARREYEGCGEYPSFTGWDYEVYAKELKQAPNMLGISVWCQTGGWVPFRRLAYIEKGSPWTEINAFVALRLFKYKESVEQTLECYFGSQDLGNYIRFFRLSDEVIKELLYTPEFAEQKLFFRRVRIPPLIGVYWNSIFINHSMKKIMRFFIKDPETCIRTSNNAMSKIKEMRTLAIQLDLPADDIEYMRQTFKLLLLARQYYFYPFDESMKKRLIRAKKKYKALYPKDTRYRYQVKMDFEPFHLNYLFLRWGLGLTLRRKRAYRLVDHIFGIYLLSIIYRLVTRARPHWVPKFARKSAMGIDTIFR